MSFLKKLASDSAIYGLNSILGRSINFLLVFIHTRAFLPDETAIIVELYAMVTFLNVLYTYGMETTFFRFATKEKENFQSVYNISQTALITSTAFFTILIILFSNDFILALNYPGQGYIIVLLAFIIGLDTIVAIPFARLRLENKAKKYVTIRLSSIAINVFLNVFFLWFCKNISEGKMLVSLQPIISKIYFPALGVGYIVIANLLANLIYIPLLWEELVNKFSFYFDKKQFTKMWEYGYPILILGLAGMVNLQFDRIMLRQILPDGFYQGLSNESVIGIYGNCYKLSVLISLATQSFRFAADPLFFSKAEDKSAPSLFAEVTKWFTLFCCILWVAICLNLDIISTIFIGKSFRSGIGIVPLLLLGNVLLGIYNNLAVWFKITDKTKFGTYITFFGAVINVLLNYILIPKIGYMGCAWAFMISALAMTVLCYFLGNKFFPVPYNVRTIMGYLAGSTLLIWLNSFVIIPNIWVSMGFHGVIFILFLTIIVVIERHRILPK
ncbi:MAG: oligosaccharide flippase family protein, partial [Bacteroidota bacterium]